MDSINQTKIKKTIFWCEELLVGDIQGLPQGIHTDDLDTLVISPDGVNHTCQTVEVEDGYSIKSTPKQMGIHTASVKKNNYHVPGSPFKFGIEPFDDGHLQVTVSGSGLMGGLVGRPGDISVSTVQAGAGALAVATEGPRSTRIDFHEESAGVCGATYLCSIPGDYKLSVKFNGKHVANSPYTVRVD